MYEDKDFLEIGFTHLLDQACDVEKESKKKKKKKENEIKMGRGEELSTRLTLRVEN